MRLKRTDKNIKWTHLIFLSVRCNLDLVFNTLVEYDIDMP